MSGAQHTPGPWDDDAAIEARNEQACRAAAAAHGLTIEQADTCDDGEHRCPTCPWRANAPIREVGRAENASRGFTEAAFKAAEVPAGTRLFVLHQPERIVQCVNAHDELVQLARDQHSAIDAAMAWLVEVDPIFRSTQWAHWPTVARFKDVIAKAGSPT